jgi:hypothetical protein
VGPELARRQGAFVGAEKVEAQDQELSPFENPTRVSWLFGSQFGSEGSKIHPGARTRDRYWTQVS